MSKWSLHVSFSFFFFFVGFDYGSWADVVVVHAFDVDRIDSDSLDDACVLFKYEDDFMLADKDPCFAISWT